MDKHKVARQLIRLAKEIIAASSIEKIKVKKDSDNIQIDFEIVGDVDAKTAKKLFASIEKSFDKIFEKNGWLLTRATTMSKGNDGVYRGRIHAREDRDEDSLGQSAMIKIVNTEIKKF